MKKPTKKKLSPLQTWANYYREDTLAFHPTKSDALRSRLNPDTETLRIAVIPLRDEERILETACLAYEFHGKSHSDSMRRALVEIGVFSGGMK